MCYFFKQTKEMTEVQKRFEALFSRPEAFKPSVYYNGFSHPETNIIIDKNPQEIIAAEWGLIPFFVDDAVAFRKKTNTLNAKFEGIETKNSFKKSVENRCLVIADSFFEWKHIGKEKIKHIIHTKDDLFTMAGIYSEWHDPESGEIKNTFSILTTEANEFMAEIHNSKKRMPVVLRKEEEDLWLRGEPMAIYHNRKEVQLLAEPLDNMPLELF